MSSIENAGLALNPKFPSVPVLAHWNRHELPTADRHLVGSYPHICIFSQMELEKVDYPNTINVLNVIKGDLIPYNREFHLF